MLLKLLNLQRHFTWLRTMHVTITWLGWALSFTVNATNAELVPHQLPAYGQQTSLLTIEKLGRYAITAESPLGVALQLIDKMRGPGNVAGVAGKNNGRLDLLLEAGEYKLLTFAPEQKRNKTQGQSKIQLQTHDFQELNQPIPRLIEHKLITSELTDFQQRSYWLEITTRQTVYIEVAGRNLADLRLWKNGSWLVNAQPDTQRIEPQPQQPLINIQVVANLQPGWYLLTAYGASAVAWSKGNAQAHPFYLRLGLPKLAPTGRQQFVTSPFGIDRWLVPRSANFYRLELNKAVAATLQVVPFNTGMSLDDNREDSDEFAEINQKSSPPVAEINTTSTTSGYNLVTIKRQAGQAYVLQHFESLEQYQFKASGQYWLSTLHAGVAENQLDVTSMLTLQTRHRRQQSSRLLTSQAILLDGHTGWQRRFNLLEPLTLYLEVTATSQYRTVTQQGKANFRIEPFFITSPPRHYKTPSFRNSGAIWELAPGYYQLTIAPQTEGKGITHASIIAEPNHHRMADSPIKPGLRWLQHFDSKFTYTLHLNNPGMPAGVVLRKIPIDLQQALPISLAPEQRLQVAITLPSRGVLQAMSETGDLLNIQVNQQTHPTHSLTAGQYQVQYHNPSQQVVNFTLQFIPAAILPDTPLPHFSATQLDALPPLRQLTETQPQFFDLTRQARHTLQVTVAQPSLYRLTSTGLLHTSGQIRTRTSLALNQAHLIDTGRNFLIQTYLREGEYQLNVATTGETYGHLGVHLNKTVLHEGGRLPLGIVARKRLSAGEGVIYLLNIIEAGNYTLQTYGLDRQWRMRLEDAAGWPLIKPGNVAQLTRFFSSGQYRLIILPQTTPARLLTVINKVPLPLQFTGHGPHSIDLNQRIQHVWHEPDANAPRIPDQWQFNLPAIADVQFNFPQVMQAQLNTVTGKPILTEIHANKTYRLSARAYQLKVMSQRPNNQQAYSLAIQTDQLLIGQSRQMPVPASVTLAIGQEQMIEISTLGDIDVSGILRDAQGKIIAQHDDSEHDWNFHITQKLSPGQYQLDIETIDATTADVTVTLRAPPQQYEPVLTLPATLSLNDTKLHIYPLTKFSGTLNVAMAAQSTDAVGLSIEKSNIEKHSDEHWQTLGSTTGHNPIMLINLNSTPTSRYRLLVWSVDKRGSDINIEIKPYTVQAQAESIFTHHGITLKTFKLFAKSYGVAKVKLTQPGLFRLRNNTNNIRWATQWDKPFAHNATGLINANQSIIRLLADTNQPLQAERVILRTKPLLVALAANENAYLNFKPTAMPQMIKATSRIGTPGITGASQHADRRGQLMGIADGAAIAFTHPGLLDHWVELWNASGNEAMTLTLQAHTFPPPLSQRFNYGHHDITLMPQTALMLNWAKPTSPIRFTLPAQSAAVWSLADQPSSVIWTGAQSKSVLIPEHVSALTLYYLGNNQAQATLNLPRPLLNEPDLTAINNNILFKQYLPTAGHIALTFDQSNSATLHLHGHNSPPLIITDSGQVITNLQTPLQGRGRILLAHNPGLVVAWLQTAHSQQWLSTQSPLKINLPEQVRLQGTLQTLQFNPDQPLMLHLRSAAPLLARLQRQNLTTDMQVFEQGVMANWYLPRGVSTLQLQNILSGPLVGTIDLTHSDIISLKEGLGPRLRIDAGESRLFAFKLSHKMPIGIGVKASQDVLKCRLLNHHGKLLGKGVIQMHTLNAGVYLLAIDSAPHNPSVEFQPALVGSEPPDTGPPQAVIQQYLANIRHSATHEE